MEKTKEQQAFTTEEDFTEKETSGKANAKDLFEEIVEVITDSFVATYQAEGNSLTMRIPNGQKFRITVEEITIEEIA